MPGEFYKQAIAGLHQDQNNRAQMEMFIQGQVADRAKEQRKATFDRANKLFDHVVKAMEGGSPEQKKYILSQFGSTLNWLGKNAPTLAQALQTTDPKRMLALKNEAFLMKNGVRPQLPVDFDIEKNPAMAMSVVHKGLQWDKVHAKQVFGQDKDIQGIYDLNGKLGFRVKPDGSTELIDWEIMNTDPQVKEFLKQHNLTLYDLKSNGGWARSGSQVVDIGDQKVHITEYWNALTHETRIDQKVLGDRPGAGGNAGSGNGNATVLPKQEVWEAVVAMNAGNYNGKSPETEALFGMLEDLGDRYQNDPAEYARMLDDVLSSVDPRFTYVPVNASEAPTLGRSFFSRDLKFGPNTRLRFIPGRPRVIETMDGAKVRVIYDEKSGGVYNMRGEKHDGTLDSIVANVRSKTAADLGIVKQAESKPVVKTQDSELPTPELVKNLPQDIKEWDVQIMSMNGQRAPYIIMKQPDGSTKPQRLTDEQFEFFKSHSGSTKLGDAIKILKDFYALLPKESKIPDTYSRSK